MYTLSTEKKLTVISALVEGNSIRSIERMSGVHRETIRRSLAEILPDADETVREYDRLIQRLNVRGR